MKKAKLTRDMVVAAVRQDFYRVMQNRIDPALPDDAVIQLNAGIVEGAENQMRDMLLFPLEQDLAARALRAARRTPGEAVEAARMVSQARQAQLAAGPRLLLPPPA